MPGMTGTPDYDGKKFTDATTDCKATNWNYWFQKIKDIYDEIGLEIKGSYDTLKTRLAVLDNTIIDILEALEGIGDISSLTTFRVNISIPPFLPGQTKAHYHIKLTTANNPAAAAVAEIETKDAQTGVSYFNGTQFVAFPAEGVHELFQGNILTWLISEIEMQEYYVFFRQYNVETESYREWHSLGKNLFQASPQGETYDEGIFILEQTTWDFTGYMLGVNGSGSIFAVWQIPCACKLLDVVVFSPGDASNIALDFKKGTIVGGFGGSICGGDTISISQTTLYQKTDLGDWDVNFSPGDFVQGLITTTTAGPVYVGLRFKKVR